MTMQSNSQQELKRICERIARLENEKAELADEIKLAKKSAKDDGFDAGLITKTVRLMRMEQEKRRKELDQMNLFDTYIHAVGLLDDTPGFENLDDDVELGGGDRGED